MTRPARIRKAPLSTADAELRGEFRRLASVHAQQGWSEGERVAQALSTAAGQQTRNWLTKWFTNRRAGESKRSNAVGEPNKELQQLVDGWDGYASRTGRLDMKPLHCAWLVSEICSFVPLDASEARSAHRRQAWAAKASRLAAQLAQALTEVDAPPAPRLLTLFDVSLQDRASRAMGQADSGPVGWVRVRLDKDGHCVNTELMRYPNQMGPLLEQEVQPALLRLAAWAKASATERKRDARPNTTSPDARVLARDLASLFMRTFAESPCAVVAELVALGLPNLDSAPTAKDVDEWLRP